MSSSPIPQGAHGVNGYYNYACRCEVCRVAASEYHRERGYQTRYREKIRSRPTPDKYHGTTTGYTEYACRCDRCRRAATEARKHYLRSASRMVDNSSE